MPGVRVTVCETLRDPFVNQAHELQRQGNFSAFEVLHLGLSFNSSEKQRTQNVLRMFLEPLLDALARAGTSAYLPVPRSERSLQLLLQLLRACSPEASGAQDGEHDAFRGDLLRVLLLSRMKRGSRSFKIRDHLTRSVALCQVTGGAGAPVGAGQAGPTEPASGSRSRMSVTVRLGT